MAISTGAKRQKKSDGLDRRKTVTEAEALVWLLGQAGWSPKDIAIRINCSERTVYRWRDDGVAPHYSQLISLQKLAEAVKKRRGT